MNDDKKLTIGTGSMAYKIIPNGEWVKKVINGMPCIVCSNCLSPRHPEVGYNWYNIYCGHCGSRNKPAKKEGNKE